MSIAVTFPSAGHHLKDAGATYNGRQENLETIKFRNLLVEELNKLGIKTITDKDYETNRDYQSRIKPAGGSVLLDIHFNAGGETATGTECLVKRKDFVEQNSTSYRMADEICKMTSEILGVRNRGVKSESATRHGRLGILNLGAGCSVLWEICFISSVLDMQSWDLKKEQLMQRVAEIVQRYDDMR